MKVECPDLASALAEGWELADTNVMGEFDVQELLMTELSRSDADDGAEGWGGCQYRYYTNADTGGRLMAIDIEWDTESDAKEFAGMFEEYVDFRYDLDRGSYEMENDWAVWDVDKEGAVALSLDGDETFVVFSSEKNPLSAAVTAIGKGGTGLAAVLENQPELEERIDEDETSSANVLVLAVVIGLLVLGLILAVAMLVIKQKEKAARAVDYPWTPPQPPWPPQPQQQWPPQQQWQRPTQQQWQQPPPPEPPQAPPDTSSDG